MAEPYLEQLSAIVSRLQLPPANSINLEPKHFFSGAALYANGKICGLFSPTGLALKLPAGQRQTLINENKGGRYQRDDQDDSKPEKAPKKELAVSQSKP